MHLGLVIYPEPSSHQYRRHLDLLVRNSWVSWCHCERERQAQGATQVELLFPSRERHLFDNFDPHYNERVSSPVVYNDQDIDSSQFVSIIRIELWVCCPRTKLTNFKVNCWTARTRHAVHWYRVCLSDIIFERTHERSLWSRKQHHPTYFECLNTRTVYPKIRQWTHQNSLELYISCMIIP